MKTNLIWKVMCIIFVYVNSGQSECICIENKQHANCVRSRLDKMNVQSKQALEKISTITIGSEFILPTNAISFDKIEHVRLSCDIKTLKFNAFENQEQLKSLDLSENLISTIPNDFFATVPLLENLNLSHNTLQNPTLDTFYALNNLKVLDASFNSISNLELGVLDEMAKLEELHLNNNKISKFKLGIFDELHDLKILDLSDNHLNEIDLSLFDKSQKLVDINLSGNYLIGEIPLGTFDNFIQVVTLNLKNCQIEKLPLGVFDRNVKLIHLDLSNNKITDLPLGIFDEAKDLKTLGLSNNALQEIPSYLFDQNGKFESLDLSYNRLKTLPELIFQSNKIFKYLNLSKNAFDTLPKRIFHQTNLTVVDISYNKFTTIEPDLLKMETLARVYAQNNRIYYLDDLTFATYKFPLKYLDIRNNRLVFLGKHFFDWVENLEHLEMFGNPWDCRCLDDILEILSRKSIKYTATDYYEGKLPICVSLETNSNKCDFNETDKDILSHYYNLYKQ